MNIKHPVSCKIAEPTQTTPPFQGLCGIVSNLLLVVCNGIEVSDVKLVELTHVMHAEDGHSSLCAHIQQSLTSSCAELLNGGAHNIIYSIYVSNVCVERNVLLPRLSFLTT